MAVFGKNLIPWADFSLVSVLVSAWACCYHCTVFFSVLFIVFFFIGWDLGESLTNGIDIQNFKRKGRDIQSVK